MRKYIDITRKITIVFCLFAFVALAWGCGEKAESPPEQPKVVSKVVKKVTPKKSVASQPPKPRPKEVAASKPEPKKEVVKPKPESSPAVSKTEEPPETQQPVEISLYNPEGKIDPFAPLFEEKREKKVVAKEKLIRERRIPLTPLEKIALGQLKLVAIVRAPSGNKALVQEASGKGYIIKKGTFIGINSGVVDQILKDMVIVDEPLSPVGEVDKNTIYVVDGKNFSISYSEGKRFINIDGKEFEAKISTIDGKDFFVDPQELKLQKPPGE